VIFGPSCSSGFSENGADIREDLPGVD